MLLQSTIKQAISMVPFMPAQEDALRQAWKSYAASPALQALLDGDAAQLADASVRVRMHTEDAAGYLGAHEGMYPVLVLLSRLPWLMDAYRERGIGEDVLRATLDDLRIWMNAYTRATGRVGLDNYSWLTWHFRCRLFRLGRLQFIAEPNDLPAAIYRDAQGNPAILPVDTTPPPGLTRLLMPGDPILQVHIPEGEPLDTQSALDSLAAAPAFFSKHISTILPAAFTCESWLMNPDLPKVAPGSNIARFAQLFTPALSEGSDAQIFERVFGSPVVDIETLPVKTRLQAAVREWYRQGGTLPSYWAYRMIPVEAR